MTATPTVETTVYYVDVPFVATASLQVERPAGLSDAEVIKSISWEEVRNCEVEHKVICLGVLDSLEENSSGICIEAD